MTRTITRNGASVQVSAPTTPEAQYEAWVLAHPDASGPQRKAIAEFLGVMPVANESLSAETTDNGALAIYRGRTRDASGKVLEAGTRVGSHYTATWERYVQEFANPEFVGFVQAAIAQARKEGAK